MNLYLKKKYGIVSKTDVSTAPWYLRMLARARSAIAAGGQAIANAAEGRYPNGAITYYPVDYPYNPRYLLVTAAAPGTVQPANIPYPVPASRLIQLFPTAAVYPGTGLSAIPLGIATDEPDNTSGDPGPYITNVDLLGGAGRATLLGITDSVVSAQTLLVPSVTVAGELRALPSVPGLYWSVGLSLSQSEGLGAQIEFDARPAIIGIGVVT